MSLNVNISKCPSARLDEMRFEHRFNAVGLARDIFNSQSPAWAEVAAASPWTGRVAAWSNGRRSSMRRACPGRTPSSSRSSSRIAATACDEFQHFAKFALSSINIVKSRANSMKQV